MYAQWVQLGLAKEKKQIMYIIHFHLSNSKAICICQIVVFTFSSNSRYTVGAISFHYRNCVINLICILDCQIIQV